MIILKHDIVIDVSQSNYTLMFDKKAKDKNGKPIYEVLGYYASLSSAIRGAKEHYIRKRLDEEVFPLNKAIEEVRRISDEFAAMLTDATGEGGKT